MWQDPQGNWIYDFGDNVAAIPLLTVEQPAGTRIKMRMGETLAADKSIEYNTTGVAAIRRRTDRRIRLHRKRQGKNGRPGSRTTDSATSNYRARRPNPKKTG